MARKSKKYLKTTCCNCGKEEVLPEGLHFCNKCVKLYISSISSGCPVGIYRTPGSVQVRKNGRLLWGAEAIDAGREYRSYMDNIPSIDAFYGVE